MRVDKLFKLNRLYFNKGLPVYLIFFVTSRCNAVCKTCFYSSNLNTRRNDEELAIEEIKMISSHFNHLWQLTLTGGEPFLRDDLDQICEIFSKQNDVQTIDIPTNCLLPEVIESKSRIFLSRCSNTFFRLSLSLDGIGVDHDLIRGVRGNFENFLETYKRLKLLKEHYKNLNIHINTVASHFNQDKLLQILGYIKSNLDIDTSNISFVRGVTRENIAKDINLDKYEAALSEAIALNKKRNERRPLAPLFRNLIDLGRKNTLKTIKEKQCVAKCFAIRKLSVINEIGEVYACEPLWDKLGSLRENNYDIKKILRKKGVVEYFKKIQKEKCFCGWECVNTLNIIYNPSTVFAFFRNLLKKCVNLNNFGERISW